MTQDNLVITELSFTLAPTGIPRNYCSVEYTLTKPVLELYELNTVTEILSAVTRADEPSPWDLEESDMT